MLGDREAILDALLNHAPIQVWGVDPELNLTYLAGGAVRSQLGGSAEVLVGAPLSDILSEDTAWALDRHRDAFAGEAQSYEIQWRETVFWVHLQPPRPGEAPEVRGIAVDITPLHEARERLREAEEQQSFALEAANAGYWHLELDPERPEELDRATLHLSPRVLAFIGFEPDEGPATVSEWRQRILDRDLPNLEEAAERHLAQETSHYQVEYRIRHRDGSLRWIRSHGRIGRDEGGRPIRWAGLDFDITEERRRVGRWEELFTHLDCAVVYQDVHGAVVDLNPHAERLLGRRKDALVGQTPPDLQDLFVDSDGGELAPSDHPPLRALRERRTIADVRMGVRRDGREEPRWVRAAAVPRLGPEGDPVEVFTIFREADRSDAD